MLCLALNMLSNGLKCNDKLLWGSVYPPLLVECGEVNLLLRVCRRPNVSLGLCQNHVSCCRNLVLHACVALDMLGNGDPHIKLFKYE